jgi:hypothetical protein
MQLIVLVAPYANPVVDDEAKFMLGVEAVPFLRVKPLELNLATSTAAISTDNTFDTAHENPVVGDGAKLMLGDAAEPAGK